MILWAYLVFPLVGGLIGGLTNHLAIRMLFRPYQAKFFLGKKIPMTPGVIPSQRHRIATDIAKIFEENLLSGNELHSLFSGEEMRGVIEAKVDAFFSGFGALGALAAGFKPKIVQTLLDGLEEAANDFLSPGGSLDIRGRIEKRINAMDIETLEKLVLGFSREQFRWITWLGVFLGALIGLLQCVIAQFINF